MTDFYRTERFNVDHTTFGGIISNYDFDGHPTMSDMASKIVSELKIDEQCRKNIENRERGKRYVK